MRALLLALSVLVACHGSKHDQTFAEGVQAICDLPDHVPAPDQRYDQRLAGVKQWADQHITNPEAKKVGNLETAKANQAALADAVKQAGVAHCKLLDNGMELQSFADAMKAVCAAPKEGAQEYFATHLLNAEVVRTFAALGEMNPDGRAEKLHALVTRAGLTECPALDRAGHAERAPTLAGEPGLEKLDGGAPVLTATTTGIVVEGKAIVAVQNGAVDPAELEGGATGRAIMRLRSFLTELRARIDESGKGPMPLVLVIDPTLPYRLLVGIVFSAEQAGFHGFQLAVHAGHDLDAIPLSLAEPAPPGAQPAGVRPIVTITKDHILLWSFSGLEGTLQKPLLEVAPDHVSDLRKAVAGIIARRKPAGDEARIVVMADSGIPVQKVAEVMAAVRTDEAGKPLFPTVLLSFGFD